MTVIIREATPEDEAFLRKMIREAAHLPPREEPPADEREKAEAADDASAAPKPLEHDGGDDGEGEGKAAEHDGGDDGEGEGKAAEHDGGANGADRTAEGKGETEARLEHYVKGWGSQDGDLGFVAVDQAAEEEHQLVGAVWIRLLTGEAKGWGHVDDETPELVIAVEPEQRGQGIGTRLMLKLVKEAKKRAGLSSICLSVRYDSRAVKLYERSGFKKLEGTELVGPSGGTSFKMKAELHHPHH